MTSVFKIVLQMSITASYVIAVVMLLRLLMRRFPKKYSYCLWSAVFFHLLPSEYLQQKERLIRFHYLKTGNFLGFHVLSISL